MFVFSFDVGRSMFDVHLSNQPRMVQLQAVNFYKIIAHNLGFGIADFGFVELPRSINFYLPRHVSLRTMLVAYFPTSAFVLPHSLYPLRASAYSAISSIVSLVGEGSNTVRAFLAVSI